MFRLIWQAGLLFVWFPNPLATGSGLGFQCPKKWEIFLWGLLAQPFGDAQGWVGSYWVRTDLSSLWRQFEFPHFTQCCCSLAFMSPSQSSLRHPPNPHFVFFSISTCISQLHLHHISKNGWSHPAGVFWFSSPRAGCLSQSLLLEVFKVKQYFLEYIYRNMFRTSVSVRFQVS